MSFEYLISHRYLRMGQKEFFVSLITFLSIAGVALGVMALIVVIAVMSGAETDIRNRILGIQSHIILMNYGGVISEVDSIMDMLKITENVIAITPLINTQAMIRSSSGTHGAIIRGIDPESVGNVILTLQKPSKLLSLTPLVKENSSHRNPGIIMGKVLAKTLNAKIGDLIYMISPPGITSSQGYAPVNKGFEVVGLFSSGMHEYDGSMAYIHIQTAQKMLHMDNSVSVMAIRLKDIFQANDTAENINAKLGFPYWARSWIQMNQNLFSALRLQKTVMFIILTLIVLVAAFNISSTLIMMVMEKTKEIAILKTMGATNKSVQTIFVYKGLIIGAFGTILGVCFGSLLCTILKYYHFIELPEDVYYFTTLPVLLDPLDVLFIALASLLLCLLATLYPAIQASRLNPVDAIRYG